MEEKSFVISEKRNMAPMEDVTINELIIAFETRENRLRYNGRTREIFEQLMQMKYPNGYSPVEKSWIICDEITKIQRDLKLLLKESVRERLNDMLKTVELTVDREAVEKLERSLILQDGKLLEILQETKEQVFDSVENCTCVYEFRCSLMVLMDSFDVTPDNLNEEIKRIRLIELAWPWKIGEKVDMEEVIFPIEYRKIKKEGKNTQLRLCDLFCCMCNDWDKLRN